ncbi:phosphoribosylformylglycinamidine synthase [Perilla frutescens var. hirtella]|nr:phosphoribosylformylglycinamidine synthase [Perilla frutescens var. hirtella]
MACRSVFKAFFLTHTEPWPPLPFIGQKRSNFAPLLLPHKKISSNCGRKLASNLESHHFARNCLSSGKSDYSKPDPPQDALLRAISEVSKREGRVGQATVVVIGGTVSDDSTTGWLALDRKVNSYPRTRGFTAIGTGGDDFVQAMIYAVESVVQRPIPEGQVRQKISSRGKYVSVKIGPVQVASSEQVQAVYYAMRSDDRMKYFL